jgi:hypothetical protein
MSAGDSAWQKARDTEREGKRLLELSHQYYRGSAGEKAVVAALKPLTELGWSLLADCRWSAQSEANIDVIAVGPGGVVVVDAKNWHRPPIVGGNKLLYGSHDCTAEAETLTVAARRVEESLAPLGISPVAVSVMMAFPGHTVDARLGPIGLIGANRAATALASLPIRFTPAVVAEVTAHLSVAFPEHRRQPPASDIADHPSEAALPTLFDVHTMLDEHARNAKAGPIEAWMTYLSPDQYDLVRRDFGGPARISGPAGTGKTVVGLHRAAHLASQGLGKVLFVTFVKSLANVQGNLLRRLKREAASNVDVRTIHSLAVSLLSRHRRAPKVDKKAIKACFDEAWASVGATALSHLDPWPGYWRDEIAYVIKGRGFTCLDDYLGPDRHGRKTRLAPVHRHAVWRLYEEYERLRVDRGLYDFADLLLLALDSVRRDPATGRYSAVIVDEAQDITLTGLRLVHSLVGNKPNGLLLIGDSMQSVYPGGYRLADAGIQIRGARSLVLRHNYRNGRAILEAAAQLIAASQIEDIDGGQVATEQVVATDTDGTVTRFVATSKADMDSALIRELRALADPAAAAVLCADNYSVERYERLLVGNGLPVHNLELYDAIPLAAIKTGTFARSKGLEFKHVFLPNFDRAIREATTGGLADSDRLHHAKSELYVAMLRARDTLWLGSVGRPGD